MNEFARLMSPLSIKEFAEKHWDKKPYFNHVKLISTDTFFDLPSLQNLTDPKIIKKLPIWLRSHSKNEKNKITAYHQIQYGLQNDYSLHIRNYHELLPSNHNLVKLARNMEILIGHPLDSVSLFITPPYSQSLPCHFDETQIFTLQIQGQKLWKYQTNPTSNKELNTRTVLSPGDLLYLPAYTYHEVTSIDQVSISLAFVFRSISYRSILNHVISSSEELQTLTKKALPILDVSSRNDQCTSDMVNDFLSKFTSLSTELNMDDIGKKLTSHQLKSLPEPPLPILPKDINLNTRFSRSASVIAIIHKSDEADNLYNLFVNGGGHMTVHKLALQELDNILNYDGVFTANDIQINLNDKQILDLLKSLYNMGIINIEKSNKNQIVSTENSYEHT